MFGTGKTAEERRKEKERKKRGIRKYGQADLKPSRKGVLACIYGGAGFLLLAGCIAYAFARRGEAHGIVGGLAILALVFAGTGSAWPLPGSGSGTGIICRAGSGFR